MRKSSRLKWLLAGGTIPWVKYAPKLSPEPRSLCLQKPENWNILLDCQKYFWDLPSQVPRRLCFRRTNLTSAPQWHALPQFKFTPFSPPKSPSKISFPPKPSFFPQIHINTFIWSAPWLSHHLYTLCSLAWLSAVSHCLSASDGRYRHIHGSHGFSMSPPNETRAGVLLFEEDFDWFGYLSLISPTCESLLYHLCVSTKQHFSSFFKFRIGNYAPKLKCQDHCGGEGEIKKYTACRHPTLRVQTPCGQSQGMCILTSSLGDSDTGLRSTGWKIRSVQLLQSQPWLGGVNSRRSRLREQP